MFNCSLSNVHNFIFHLVAVLRDSDFRIKVLRASAPNDQARSILNISPDMSEEDLRVLSVIIFGGERICEEMALPATKIAINSLKRVSEKPNIHVEDYVSGVRAIHDALFRELMSQYLYYYPPEKAAHLGKLNGEDWKSIFVAIPNIEKDIRAGVDCWAMGHNHAAVFHMMRALEFGVQVFGKRFGVNIVKTHPSKHVRELTWEQVLNDLSGPLRLLPMKTVAQKRKVEKLKAAQSYLYGVKDAWRNPTMHPRSEGYNDLQTQDIINQTRGFFTELAGVFSRR